MWSERKEERTEEDNKKKRRLEINMRNVQKREMTYGMYSGGGGVRCLRSYAFEGANHLLKTILFHKLTVLWNFYLNW
jgi:hypothetical protein